MDFAFNSRQLVRIAEILKVIAHPVRLEILELLHSRPGITVNEIQSSLTIDIEQSALSHHLIKMKDKGIITCERNGVYMEYELQDGKLMNLFECMAKCDMVMRPSESSSEVPEII